MKTFLIAPALFLLVINSSTCNKKEKNTTALKARLETKALCSNYTFTLIGGSLDTTLVNSSWTDETTGKVYASAFGIANPCEFPATINAGDEFYFVLDNAPKKDCTVCMAYYPTPSRKLSIRVIPKP